MTDSPERHLAVSQAAATGCDTSTRKALFHQREAIKQLLDRVAALEAEAETRKVPV